MKSWKASFQHVHKIKNKKLIKDKMKQIVFLFVMLFAATTTHAQQVVASAGNTGTMTGYVTCDVARLPFREGSFDLLVSDSTLDHLKTEGEIRQALGELARVLAPGGRLILTIDNPTSLTYPPRWLVKLWMRLGLAPYYIGVTLPLVCLRANLEDLGLRVEHETAILHYPHPDGLVRLCERCARAIGLGKLDGLIARFFAAAEQLGGTRLRYLTGRYLAVDAIKGNNL